MCGYCIERGVILFETVSSEKIHKKINLDNNFLDVRLLEITEIKTAIKQSKNFSNFIGCADVLLYRLIEHNLNYGYDEDFFEILLDSLSQETVIKFLTKVRENNGSGLGVFFANPDIYKNAENWNFMLDTENLILNSETVLATYIHWWLHGNDRIKSDPDIRMEEIGIMDPIANTPPDERKKFYDCFPVLFFALCLIIKCKPESNLLQQIALTHPDGIPDFSGYDLWLQRKAFLSCVQTYGVVFIINSVGAVRDELIYYVLLMLEFTSNELCEIKLLFNNYSNPDLFGIESQDMLELINFKLKNFIA